MTDSFFATAVSVSSIPELDDVAQPGTPFSSILQAGVARGVLDTGGKSPEAWIAERLRRHSKPEGLVEYHHGTMWVRVSEQRTPDGSTVVVYTDISELKQRQQELEEAMQQQYVMFCRPTSTPYTALGTDTGNSIRGPSAHQALVGIRSTMGLTSRAGVAPLNLASDIAGPMARTVADAVAIFQVVAGEDGADSVTARAQGTSRSRLPTFLDRNALKGARSACCIRPTTARRPTLKSSTSSWRRWTTCAGRAPPLSTQSPCPARGSVSAPRAAATSSSSTSTTGSPDRAIVPPCTRWPR